LYVEGFTISGARNKLALEHPTPEDVERLHAIKALISELEDVLAMLNKP